eukprot:125937-Ditylum_brightwellii.AAC.1
MEDSDALIAMNFMGELLLYAYFTNQGVGESSFALASCSVMLHARGDLRASKLFSHFALSLLARLDCKDMLSR